VPLLVLGRAALADTFLMFFSVLIKPTPPPPYTFSAILPVLYIKKVIMNMSKLKIFKTRSNMHDDFEGLETFPIKLLGCRFLDLKTYRN